MQQRNESEEGISVRDGANIAYFASHTLSLCWTVLTRQRFGSEAFGVPGVVAFLILLLTANCSQEWGMAILSGVWFVFLASHRVETFRSWRNGIRRHSRAGGDQWITKVFFRDEVNARRLEPFLCVGIALLVCTESVFTGKFLLFCAGALLVRNVMESQIDRIQLRDLRDAEIEQECLVSQWRRDRGEF